MLSVLAVPLLSCSRAPSLPQSSQTDAPPETSRRLDGAKPCTLLTREEVELALNERQPSFEPMGRPILIGMTICTASRGDSVASWGVLSKSATGLFDRYLALNHGHTRKVDGVGDAAVWDEGLKTLVVRQADRGIGVRLRVAHPPVGTPKARQDYVAVVAKRLAARVLERTA